MINQKIYFYFTIIKNFFFSANLGLLSEVPLCDLYFQLDRQCVCITGTGKAYHCLNAYNCFLSRNADGIFIVYGHVGAVKHCLKPTQHGSLIRRKGKLQADAVCVWLYVYGCVSQLVDWLSCLTNECTAEYSLVQDETCRSYYFKCLIWFGDDSCDATGMQYYPSM